MSFPRYSARPLFSQFHLFFHGAVSLSVPALRALAYHELASAALETEPSRSSSSGYSGSDLTDSADEETLCDAPLTPEQLRTFRYVQHRALVPTHELFFVVTKLFATSCQSESAEPAFRRAEPWLSSNSTCLGCGSRIDADCTIWIEHRDSCTGIEDRMLQSVFVQSETLTAIKLVWDTAQGISRSMTRTPGWDFTFEDYNEAALTPDRLAKTNELVRDWLNKIEY